MYVEKFWNSSSSKKKYMCMWSTSHFVKVYVVFALVWVCVLEFVCFGNFILMVGCGCILKIKLLKRQENLFATLGS